MFEKFQWVSSAERSLKEVSWSERGLSERMKRDEARKNIGREVPVKAVSEKRL